MKSGESVLLLDGKGSVARGAVIEIDRTHTLVEIDSTSHTAETRPRLHLFQGLPHGAKMDDVVYWSVELGAASLVPFRSTRTRDTDASLHRRLERWRRIAVEASRVAGRLYLAEVAAVKTWQEAVSQLCGMELVLLADEAGGVRPAHALADKSPDELALVIGPEGGFSDAEREDLAAAGALPVTLGENVLRTQTAGMVLLAAVKCHFELL
jgi:16S rRNA (uracil1498-N3)-methyltransferase